MKKTLLLPLSTKCTDTLPLVNTIRTWLAQHPDEFELIFLHDMAWSDDWLSPRDLLFAEFADEFQQMGQRLFEQLTETLRLDVPKELFISIIGTWLYSTMSSVLELYKLCTACTKHVPLANARVLSFQSAALASHDSLDGTEIYAGSTLRLAVFGAIATQLGMQSIAIPPGAFPRAQKLHPRRELIRVMTFAKNWVLEGCYNFLALVIRRLLGGHPVIADSRRMAIAIFSVKHKVFPQVINIELSQFFKRGRDQALRQSISSAFQSTRDDFSKLFLGLVPDLMPVELLENNLQRLTTVQQSKPQPSSAIFSFNNQTGPQLARKQLSNGQRAHRVTVTHGGGFGIDGFVGEEVIDGDISHTVFTFGWSTKSNTVHFRPDFLTEIHLHHATRNSFKAFQTNRFALAGNSNPQYCYKVSGGPNSPTQVNKYYTDQQSFYCHLGAGLADQFVHRPAQWTFGHQQERWFESANHPELAVKFHDGAGFNCLSYELLVMDHIGTTLTIRALANLPFLLFCRPEWWPINAQAKETIAHLKLVGVWHDSPKSAANCLLKISDGIISWWDDKSTRKAVSEFKRNYCGAESPSLTDAVGSFLLSSQQVQ